MELSAMSPGELKKLAARIEKEVTDRNKKNLGQAIVEMKVIAAKYNVTLAEAAAAPTTSRKPRDKTASKKKAVSSAKKPKVIRYQHPDNKELGWPGGRGRRPDWVKAWMASGRDIEETRIAGVN